MTNLVRNGISSQVGQENIGYSALWGWGGQGGGEGRSENATKWQDK